jgi:hypothetical protein
VKIYQIHSVMPVRGGKPKRAPLLEGKSSARQFLAGERFRGQPFPDKWKKVELNFGPHTPWPADFYFYGPGALVCSEKAMDTLAPLEDEGEFLPVRLNGIRGNYFLYNSTNCRSYLNEKRTTWKQRDSTRGHASILKHAFWAERISDDCLFKILDEGAIELYCVERSGDPYDDEFKALVEADGLSGLAFKRVWSGGR